MGFYDWPPKRQGANRQARRRQAQRLGVCTLTIVHEHRPSQQRFTFCPAVAAIPSFMQ